VVIICILCSEVVFGDLVFMFGYVGIYVGNGMMWDVLCIGEVVYKCVVYFSSVIYGWVG